MWVLMVALNCGFWFGCDYKEISFPTEQLCYETLSRFDLDRVTAAKCIYKPKQKESRDE